MNFSYKFSSGYGLDDFQIPPHRQAVNVVRNLKRPVQMVEDLKWLSSFIVLLAFYIPFSGACQDTTKAIVIERQIQRFEHSPTLQTVDTSSCWLYDLGRDRESCLDNWQTATAKAFPNIIRYKIESGFKGKYLDKRIYYYINKQLSKITAQKSLGGKLVWDSEIYLSGETVLLQKDKSEKVNPVYFIQDAKAKVIW